MPRWLIVILYFLSGSCDNSGSTAVIQSNATESNAPEYFYVDTTLLTGVLSREGFYGPPGFGESPAQDSKDTFFILHLFEPINIRARPDADSSEIDFTYTVDSLKEVQLDLRWQAVLNIYVGKKIKLRGTLSPAFTGQQNTAATFVIKELIKHR